MVRRSGKKTLKLSRDGHYRDGNGHRTDYTNCKNNSIFCNGIFHPKTGLCHVCVQRPSEQGRWVYSLLVFSHSRYRNGKEAQIMFNRSMFASRKRVRLSYNKWKWERAAGRELPPGYQIVNLSGKLFPESHDLVAVPRKISATNTGPFFGKCVRGEI